jgi:hypothetical protein
MPDETKQRPPEHIYCNLCRGLTLHRIVGTNHTVGRDEEQGFWWSKDFEMLQCGGCHEVILRRTFNFSETDGVEVQYFPPPVSRYPPRWRYKLPTQLRLLLEEIYRSLDSDNLRLPIMGARTLVDMLIIEKVGDIGNFAEKLKALQTAGFLKNRDVLEAALDAGNAAAHRGHAASESEVQAVMDIVENMLQAIYVFPDVAKKLRETTPPRVRTKAKSP